MTGADTYTYEIDLASELGGVTRARGRKKGVQGFLSVDPLAGQFPTLSPYQFAANSPISGDDLDGLEWRLRIFSPNLSGKMIKAISAGNIVEQRKISFYALNHEFINPDGNISHWASKKSESFSARRNNFAGELIFDPSAPEGLTMDLYAWSSDEGSSYIVATDVMSASERYSFSFAPGEIPDRYFPVDVKLLDFDGSMDGDDYYGDLDFKDGSFSEVTVVAGGGGVMAGRMKGYGYLEFSTKSLGGQLDVGIGYGLIEGTYSGLGATPANPFGKLADFLGGGETNMLSQTWSSKNWSGISPTVGASFNTNLPGVAGNAASTYTTLFHEFISSKRQSTTFTRESAQKESTESDRP